MSLAFVRPCQVSFTASKTRSTAPSHSTSRSGSGARNMMAGTVPTPSVAKKRRWLPSAPTRERLRMLTPRAAKRGFLLPWPNGCRASSDAMVSTESSPRPMTAVTSSVETNCSAGSSASTPSSRSRNSSRRDASQVTPTAPACPPKRIRQSEHCSTAWKRSTEPTERPLPRATPSTTEKRMAGTWNRLTMREATMPLTPSCQPSPPTTMAWEPSWGSSSIAAMAEAVSSDSMARRSVFVSSSLVASSCASRASSTMSRSKATSVVPMRPAALRRGMMENGSESAVAWEISMFAVAASAAMPGRGLAFIRAMPSATRARFSPCSSIMSESVPSMATSV